MSQEIANSVEAALIDVERAFHHLEFAIRRMDYCEAGYLNLEQFNSDITILFERENVGFRPGLFASQEGVIRAAQANVGVSFGASASVARKERSVLRGDGLAVFDTTSACEKQCASIVLGVCPARGRIW